MYKKSKSLKINSLFMLIISVTNKYIDFVLNTNNNKEKKQEKIKENVNKINYICYKCSDYNSCFNPNKTQKK